MVCILREATGLYADHYDWGISWGHEQKMIETVSVLNLAIRRLTQKLPNSRDRFQSIPPAVQYILVLQINLDSIQQLG